MKMTKKMKALSAPEYLPGGSLRKLIVREGRYRMLYMVTDLMNAACDSQHDPLDFQSVCPPGTRAQAEAPITLFTAIQPKLLT